jgi:hypothetical protein
MASGEGLNVAVNRDVQPSAMSHDVIRLWRVRKHNNSIDAQLIAGDDATSARLDFFYDGDRIFSRDFTSRDLAVADAELKLRELQRAGWNTHW